MHLEAPLEKHVLGRLIVVIHEWNEYILVDMYTRGFITSIDDDQLNSVSVGGDGDEHGDEEPEFYEDLVMLTDS